MNKIQLLIGSALVGAFVFSGNIMEAKAVGFELASDAAMGKDSKKLSAEAKFDKKKAHITKKLEEMREVKSDLDQGKDLFSIAEEKIKTLSTEELARKLEHKSKVMEEIKEKKDAGKTKEQIKTEMEEKHDKKMQKKEKKLLDLRAKLPIERQAEVDKVIADLKEANKIKKEIIEQERLKCDSEIKTPEKIKEHREKKDKIFKEVNARIDALEIEFPAEKVRLEKARADLREIEDIMHGWWKQHDEKKEKEVK